jgi:hypothetical protein
MGPPATSAQSSARPGPDTKKVAEARIKAARDQHAAIVKMHAESAKRAEAIKKKVADGARATDRDKAVKARLEAAKKKAIARKKTQAEKSEKAQEKK